MRREAECFAEHRGNALGIEQIVDEVLVVTDDLAVRGGFTNHAETGWVNVKGSLGSVAVQALAIVNQAHDHIAAFAERGIVHLNKILLAIECGNSRGLRNRTGVRGTLRLQHVHGLDQ